MNLIPANKYLLVEPVEEEEEKEEFSLLLPEGVDIKATNPHAVVTLLRASSTEWADRVGMNLVCPRHSVENFVFKGETYYLLPENHIIAYF